MVMLEGQRDAPLCRRGFAFSWQPSPRFCRWVEQAAQFYHGHTAGEKSLNSYASKKKKRKNWKENGKKCVIFLKLCLNEGIH